MLCYPVVGSLIWADVISCRCVLPSLLHTLCQRLVLSINHLFELNQPDSATCPNCLLRQPADLETKSFLSQIFVFRERSSREEEEKFLSESKSSKLNLRGLNRWIRVLRLESWSTLVVVIDHLAALHDQICFACYASIGSRFWKRKMAFMCSWRKVSFWSESLERKPCFCVCSCMTFLYGYPGPCFELIAWNLRFL